MHIRADWASLMVMSDAACSLMDFAIAVFSWYAYYIAKKVGNDLAKWGD